MTHRVDHYHKIQNFEWESFKGTTSTLEKSLNPIVNGKKVILHKKLEEDISFPKSHLVLSIFFLAVGAIIGGLLIKENLANGINHTHAFRNLIVNGVVFGSSSLASFIAIIYFIGRLIKVHGTNLQKEDVDRYRESWKKQLQEELDLCTDGAQNAEKKRDKIIAHITKLTECKNKLEEILERPPIEG